MRVFVTTGGTARGEAQRVGNSSPPLELIVFAGSTRMYAANVCIRKYCAKCMQTLFLLMSGRWTRRARGVCGGGCSRRRPGRSCEWSIWRLPGEERRRICRAQSLLVAPTKRTVAWYTCMTQDSTPPGPVFQARLLRNEYGSKTELRLLGRPSYRIGETF